MKVLKKLGKKIEVGIEKIDGQDPMINCHQCNRGMVENTSSPTNWQCMYCKRAYKGKDGYYRLTCPQDKLDVCRDCGKSIQNMEKLYYEFPVKCGICQQNLINATRWRQNWQCHKCNVNYKMEKTKGRFYCQNHNLNFCYDCVKSEKEQFLTLNEKLRENSIIKNLKNYLGGTQQVPNNFYQNNNKVYMMFPNKEHSNVLRYQQYAYQNNNTNNTNFNQYNNQQQYQQNQNQYFNKPAYNQNQNQNYNPNVNNQNVEPQYNNPYFNNQNQNQNYNQNYNQNQYNDNYYQTQKPQNPFNNGKYPQFD